MTDDNPYVGPRALATGEKLWGRDEETATLYGLLIAERIVLLYSSSGAGKTSLINAGVSPLLRKRKFYVFDGISLRTRPDIEEARGANRYAMATMLSIQQRLPPKEQLAPGTLALMPLAAFFDRMLTWAQTQDNRNLVLIFDQFEEILTLDQTDDDAKQSFMLDLGEALENGKVWCVFSMRDEFVVSIDDLFARYVPGRLQTRMRLNLLSRTAAVEAICGPARERQIDFSAAGTLADDLRAINVQRADGTTEEVQGKWVEPVQLQVVCRAIWSRPRANPSEISERDLEGIEIDDALSQYYDECIAAVASVRVAEERKLREWIGDHLISAHGVRTRVLMEPRQTADLDNEAIDGLVATHLLRREEVGNRVWYELAHDRLVDPIRISNDRWMSINLAALSLAAKRWRDHGRRKSGLLKGAELVEALRWSNNEPVSDLERELIDVSLKNLSAFRRAAIEWEAADRDPEKLLGGARLAAAEDTASRMRHLSATEQAFLKSSRAQQLWQSAQHGIRLRDHILALLGGFIALSIAGGWFSIDSLKNKLVSQENALSTAVADKSRLERLETPARKLAIAYALQPQKIDSATLADVIGAQARLAELSFTHPTPKEIDVSYYAKPGDDPKLKDALAAEGFTVITREQETDLPTNCIWYGSGIPESSVKIIAYVLIRAGVGIQTITPFMNSTKRENVVQIGGNPRMFDETPITSDDVDRQPLASLSRPEAESILDDAPGVIDTFNPRTREGTVRIETTMARFRDVDHQDFTPGQTVILNLYRNARGAYAVHVQPTGGAPSPPKPDTATSTTAPPSPDARQ